MKTCNKTRLPVITKSANNLLKILFEAMVLIHHLSIFSGFLGNTVTGILGPVGVCGFLFCSGYGVGENYKVKGFDFSKKLLLKKVPHFYFVIIITNAFYLIAYLINGNSFESVFSAVGAVLNLHAISGVPRLSHWLYFINDLMIYYIMFFLASYLFRKRENTLLPSAIFILTLQTVIIVILTIINEKTGNSMSLRGCILFPLGLLTSYYNNKIVKFLKNFKGVLIFGLLSVGILFLTLFDDLIFNEYITSALFALSVCASVFKLNPKSKGLNFAGKLVIYVYLSHEFFWKTFNNLMPSLSHELIIVLTLILTISVSLIINLVVETLKKLKTKKIIVAI